MKNSWLNALIVTIPLISSGGAVWADSEGSSSRLSLAGEDNGIQRLSDLDMHLNPQIGMGTFGLSSSTDLGRATPSGGATVEFGGASRKLETGLLVIPTSASANIGTNGSSTDIRSTYLAIPMMAKLRILTLPKQSWYAKFGVTTAYGVNQSAANSNPVDILAGVGMGARFAFTQKADFIVETTYNRGLLPALSTDNGNFNQGLLVLAGLSFRI